MKTKLFLDKNKLITYRDIACFAIGLILATSVISFVLWFNDNYKFQPLIVPREMSPVPEKSPIITIPTEKPVPKTSPKPKAQTKAEIVANSKYPDFIDHIWVRETGRGSNKEGLNGYCLGQGLSNEFGFYPSGKHCFPTFEASVQRLEKWYEVDSKGLSYNQKLCYYNGAGKIDSCAYLTYNFEAMK